MLTLEVPDLKCNELLLKQEVTGGVSGMTLLLEYPFV